MQDIEMNKRNDCTVGIDVLHNILKVPEPEVHMENKVTRESNMA